MHPGSQKVQGAVDTAGPRPQEDDCASTQRWTGCTEAAGAATSHGRPAEITLGGGLHVNAAACLSVDRYAVLKVTVGNLMHTMHGGSVGAVLHRKHMLGRPRRMHLLIMHEVSRWLRCRCVVPIAVGVACPKERIARRMSSQNKLAAGQWLVVADPLQQLQRTPDAFDRRARLYRRNPQCTSAAFGPDYKSDRMRSSRCEPLQSSADALAVVMLIWSIARAGLALAESMHAGRARDCYHEATRLMTRTHRSCCVQNGRDLISSLTMLAQGVACLVGLTGMPPDAGP